MEQYLEIGKIVNTHGIKGELKVIPLTDAPDRFKKLKWAYLDKNTSMDKVFFEDVKFFKGFVILKLKEVDDIDSAEALKNLFLKVDRENAVKLAKDSFFVCDLLECEVYDIKENKLGILKDILKTGSNDVYVVKDENNKEILIPALKSVVKEISIENRKITVVLPEGLVENEI